MIIKIHCPKCDQKISGDDCYYGGKQVECPICKTMVNFPVCLNHTPTTNSKYNFYNKSLIIISVTVVLMGLLWLIKPLINTDRERILLNNERQTADERIRLREMQLNDKVTSIQMIQQQIDESNKISNFKASQKQDEEIKQKYLDAKYAFYSLWSDKLKELVKSKAEQVTITMEYLKLKMKVESEYSLSLDSLPSPTTPYQTISEQNQIYNMQNVNVNGRRMTREMARRYGFIR